MAKKTYVPGYGYVEQDSPGTSGSVEPGKKPYDSGQDPNFNKKLYGTTNKPKPPAPPPPPATVAPPPPVRSQIRIDVTPNKQVGKPAGVKAAEADRVAALAALAAEQRRQDAALRDQYSQSLMAAQSSAADVYGGRAPAIFGQAVTGGRRQYVSGRSQQVQENVAQRAEMQRAYAEAIRQAYAAAAAQRQQDAFNRAQLSMAASQMMGY
jgi:hypothetical protein